MTDVTPSVFKVIQAYGGLKQAYIEVAAMDSDDVILLEDENVKKVMYIDLCEEDDTAGRVKLSFIRDAYDPTNVSPTYGNELTLKSGGKSAIKVSGIIMWRDY